MQIYPLNLDSVLFYFVLFFVLSQFESLLCQSFAWLTRSLLNSEDSSVCEFHVNWVIKNLNGPSYALLAQEQCLQFLARKNIHFENDTRKINQYIAFKSNLANALDPENSIYNGMLSISLRIYLKEEYRSRQIMANRIGQRFWLVLALGRGPIIGLVAIRPNRIGVCFSGPVIFI